MLLGSVCVCSVAWDCVHRKPVPLPPLNKSLTLPVLVKDRLPAPPRRPEPATQKIELHGSRPDNVNASAPACFTQHVHVQASVVPACHCTGCHPPEPPDEAAVSPLAALMESRCSLGSRGTSRSSASPAYKPRLASSIAMSMRWPHSVHSEHQQRRHRHSSTPPMWLVTSAITSSAPGTPASMSWRRPALKRWIARSVVRALLSGVVMAAASATRHAALGATPAAQITSGVTGATADHCGVLASSATNGMHCY